MTTNRLFPIFSPILILFTCSGVLVHGHTDTHYRAAVVEFNAIRQPQPTLESTLANAYVLAKYAVEARWEDVDILVFPEYGLTGLTNPDRDYVPDYVQSVPDPNYIPSWNPCLEPNRYPNTKVIQVLSCAARFNAMVIVANVVGQEPCDGLQGPCRPDNKNFYNTNVIFFKDGTLAGRYRKRHLFKEPNLEASPTPEYTTVDLGFMKFATVVCHDLIFLEPAINVVKQHGIRNIIMPTAWINVLPFATAPQIFSGYAHGLGVNLIAANLYSPQSGILGSGIFSSSSGSLNQTYDLSTPGKMIIADVPIHPRDVSQGDLTCDDDTHDDHSEEYGSVTQTFLTYEKITMSNQPSSKPDEPPTNLLVNLPMKPLTVFFLDKLEGHVDLCKNDFCCNLDYEFLTKDEPYAFAVMDGVVTMDSNTYGAQLCAVLRCESEEDKETCGRVPNQPTESEFSLLTISGTFETEVVYPQILGADLQVVSTDNWKYSRIFCEDTENGGELTIAKIELDAIADQPILSASLMGRIFERDSSS